jgi:hypothetical protein
MEEMQKPILPSSKEWKEVKAEIQRLKKSKIEQFKDEWMDGQEVTLALHISLRTLQTLRDSGQLPSSKVHKKLYYKTSDVKALLESNYSISPLTQKS